MDITAVAQHIMKRDSSPSMLGSGAQPWILINRCFTQDADSDFRFWWRTTGLPFAILLQKAGYTVDHQYQSLLFYYYYVVPELGAGPDAQGLPRSWQSFMTDHFCPVELSWEWGCLGESPTIRFSFEPIGPNAGTSTDPFNQYSTSRLIHQYQRTLSNCDLRCFDHFSKELLSYSNCQNETTKTQECEGHESRIFFGCDLGKGGVMLKAYFLPTFRAVELGKSTLAVILEAIHSLPNYSPSQFPALPALLRFLTTSPEGAGLKAEIFAIDCVAPAASRFKIYMRNCSTCFNSVRTIMRLDGALTESNLTRGLEELQTLWNLVLGKEEGFSPAQSLQHKEHRTAGILYYFDIRSGQALPGVKVYIPVRHYGQNDLAIAQGLRVYLESRGQGSLVRRYLEALKSIS